MSMYTWTGRGVNFSQPAPSERTSCCPKPEREVGLVWDCVSTAGCKVHVSMYVSSACNAEAAKEPNVSSCAKVDRWCKKVRERQTGRELNKREVESDDRNEAMVSFDAYSTHKRPHALRTEYGEAGEFGKVGAFRTYDGGMDRFALKNFSVAYSQKLLAATGEMAASCCAL